MRVLVIDDDKHMRILLRQVMEMAGYEVTVAGDGREGMELQRARPADLVITDLIMPEQEGLETIGTLKKEFDEVKIIAISGGGRIGPEAYLPTAKELGADRIFTKPFDIQAILAAARELLGNGSS